MPRNSPSLLAMLPRILSGLGCVGATLWVATAKLEGEGALPSEPAEVQALDFGVFWPPQDPQATGRTAARALLQGQVRLRTESLVDAGWVVRVRLRLSRPADEAGRVFWNTRLAFPEYDWMSSVRLWDQDHRWLWPNLAYLLRLHGQERVERYGGVDPGKGVDNDFAAVLIRKYGADGGAETKETTRMPLVSAEWYPVGQEKPDGRSVVHMAESDEFTLHLGAGGGVDDGCAGVWLIYADFLGAPPPSAWPKEAEYAGGILAYFEIRWSQAVGGRPLVRVEQLVPRRSTGFDWERWTQRTLASPDTKRTAKLSDREEPKPGARASTIIRQTGADPAGKEAHPVPAEPNQLPAAIAPRQ